MDETVSRHYNKVSKSSAALKINRPKSACFELRTFNNFCKNLLIESVVNDVRRKNRPVTVFDLCCGRGGDLIKWKKSQVDHLIAADISPDSINEFRTRFEEMNMHRYMTLSLYVSDCGVENLWLREELKSKVVDATSCQFALHYSFESFEKASMMLHNACSHLRRGGIFFGIIPNSCEILRHFLKKGFGKLENEIFKLEMREFKNKLFGDVYHFKLEDFVDCPEFLIYFPLLCEMLKKYNMRCVKWEPLQNFFLSNFSSNYKMLTSMKALKVFTTSDLVQISTNDTFKKLNYSHLTSYLKRGKLHINDMPLSLSVEEWQIVRFYSVFSFKRDIPAIDPIADHRNCSSVMILVTKNFDDGETK
ncbi:mRNA cap guanine-N7 methyltransferase [Thelohanellus kitauei]|uniref:mRNA cap guanine-N(7) methyltransferase n=1 Tax=Thelohanellus kitauei TaxID=669202 RepID=A0A0C2MR28_THEKT|nr:mRNA cap guanine-N7 methyltransferase [Thelohanellus kitauei]